MDKQELLQFLRENLRIEVQDGDFTDPNKRYVQLVLDGEVNGEASFTVRQTREYEG